MKRARSDDEDLQLRERILVALGVVDPERRFNKAEKRLPSGGKGGGQWTKGGVVGKVVDALGDALGDVGDGKGGKDGKVTLDDAAFEQRVASVGKIMGDARKTLATEHTMTTPSGAWTPERDAVHRTIAADVYAAAAHVPNDRRAVIAGGLGGSGKTTVLTKHAGINPKDYLTVNPDDIKEEMVRRGLVPDVPGHPELSPMERASLIHEESSRIASLVADQAYRDGKNIMWDITMSSESSVVKRIDAMTESGYQQITGVFVNIPVEVSVERAMARYRRGAEDYLNGEGPGGRFVPPDIIRAQRTRSGDTVNHEVFEKIKGNFSDWSMYDNSVTGRAPQLVEQAKGKGMRAPKSVQQAHWVAGVNTTPAPTGPTPQFKEWPQAPGRK